MNPISWLLRTVIRGYQRFISPLFPARCRYYPTCSAYAVEAITIHGAIKGIGLGAWRLLRCNPWSLGGIDHVPGHQEDEVDRIIQQMERQEPSELISGRED